MILSGGSLVLKSSPQTVWAGSTSTWDGRALESLGYWSSYSQLYRKQLWVAAAVNKIAGATARLPLKVYRRGEDGRSDARDTPFGELMQRPSKTVDPYTFWTWTRAILDIHGESFLGKVRDRTDRPVELVRLHPTYMRYNEGQWRYDDGTRRFDIRRRDLVHFKHFSPDSDRGMSPLEPLRATLENEDGARRANNAMWSNGGRPSVFLEISTKLNKEQSERLAQSWNSVHGGVDNWAKAAVLEEGLKANVLPLNVEELQYIESRKLNREEVCAGYDIPPPALHILDRATFANITEQNRALYRDTMAPKLGHLEATIEMELRDGSMGDGEPDFPDDVYAEFLMDEVLRGAFEARAQAYQQADYMTMAEKRRSENLPFLPGTDRIFLNSASLPLGSDGQLEQPAAPVSPALPAAPQLALPPGPKSLSVDAYNTVMGRLSRVKTIDDVKVGTLTAGLNGSTAAVLDALNESETVEAFKACLKALKG